LNKNKYKIGKVYISITSIPETIKSIEELVKNQKTEYICVSDFRSVCFAYSNSEYQKIMENSYLNLPDGMPLIWMSRLWGIKETHRTMGPDLFTKMITNPHNGIKHFLLGDTDEILLQINNEFKEKYKSLIAGSFSPPFINVEEYDYNAIAEIINRSQADILWISMTAPKQDFFAAKIKPLLSNKVIIGVGAAFRYSLGLYTIPNGFYQKIGLTGFFMRKKSWWQFKWYMKHISILIFFSSQILLKRLVGIKYYR